MRVWNTSSSSIAIFSSKQTVVSPSADVSTALLLMMRPTSMNCDPSPNALVESLGHQRHLSGEEHTLDVDLLIVSCLDREKFARGDLFT
jgi:hypothetical protein